MSKSGIAWRKVSRGILLLGLGVVLLCNTQGLLPWAFWLDAAAYWPVLLVALGIRLIFERTRAPWGVLLSPMLILGALAFAALGGAPAPGDWHELRAERPAEAQRWSLEGGLAGARVEVVARELPDDLLLDGRARPAGRPWVRTTGSDETVRVRLGGAGRRHGVVVLWPGRSQRWDLTVSPALPLEVDLDLAFADALLDLSAAPVSRVSLEGAFHDTTLRLGVPSSDTRVRVEGAFFRLRLEVPDATPVRVRSDGFLNFVEGRTGAGSLDGPGYDLALDGAFNRLEVVSP